MATENRNPKDAKPVGGRQPQTDPSPQPGQSTKGAGNEKGQRIAQQQGGKGGGTADQGGHALGAGLDQKGGPLPQDRDRRADGHRGLRQGTPDTEETED